MTALTTPVARVNGPTGDGISGEGGRWTGRTGRRLIAFPRRFKRLSADQPHRLHHLEAPWSSSATECAVEHNYG